MERKHIISFIIVCGLLALLSLSLAFSPEIIGHENAGIRELPICIGKWKGESIVFCQSDQCGHSFEASVVGTNNACPDCNMPLGAISIAEQKLLPIGTDIRKQRYKAPSGPSYFTSIVLSTQERRSIHQPQVCLKAQGYLIMSERVIDVKLTLDHTLRVKLLDLQPSPGSKLYPATFAFWFSSKEKETPSGWQRLLWIMQDRVLYSKASQWAYIGVMTNRRNGSDEHISRLQKFIAQLYPLIKDDDVI